MTIFDSMNEHFLTLTASQLYEEKKKKGKSQSICLRFVLISVLHVNIIPPTSK